MLVVSGREQAHAVESRGDGRRYTRSSGGAAVAAGWPAAVPAERPGERVRRRVAHGGGDRCRRSPAAGGRRDPCAMQIEGQTVVVTGADRSLVALLERGAAKVYATAQRLAPGPAERAACAPAPPPSHA